MIDYYRSRKPKLLKQFDRTVNRLQPVLADRYGAELCDFLLKDARREFAALIPELSYLGGRQPFTQFIVAAAWFLALYRALQHQGKTVEEAGILVYQTTMALLESYPRFLHRIFGYIYFTRLFKNRIKKRAIESQHRRYPGDYVFNFIEGDGVRFDFGVDYLECGTCKFLAQQKASELSPFICTVDEIYSKLFNWGLTRTMTLAQGHAKCDFRFKKRAKTNVPVPEYIKPYQIV